MAEPFEDLDLSGSDVPALRVSLRIRGESLDPDFVTQQLGVAPSMRGRAGEDGETGEWIYRLPAHPETELGELLDMLIASFPHDATLWEELTSTYSVDVLVTVALEGETGRTVIDAPVLERLGRLGLSVGFELHA